MRSSGSWSTRSFRRTCSHACTNIVGKVMPRPVNKTIRYCICFWETPPTNVCMFCHTFAHSYHCSDCMRNVICCSLCHAIATCKHLVFILSLPREALSGIVGVCLVRWHCVLQALFIILSLPREALSGMWCACFPNSLAAWLVCTLTYALMLIAQMCVSYLCRGRHCQGSFSCTFAMPQYL